jgi:hypothetical protein
MRNFNLTVLLFAIALGACGQVTEREGETGFITKLGDDTLAVESFQKTSNGIEAKVLLRTPQTELTSYRLIQDENGGIQEMTALRYESEVGFQGEGVFNHSVIKHGDSLLVDFITRSGDRRSFAVVNEEGTLPFIDMVHWPFELAFERAVEMGKDTVHQNLLSGNRISDFIIAAIQGDSMTIRHPYRGVMGVNVNNEGELEFLDAGLTTRKLKVYRRNDIDIQSIARSFIKRDKSGSPFGALSGAETGKFEINGAEFQVEYGSPKRRGRDLFGGIVPWGERWRTGANRATHFKTSRDLRIGGLNVPAGEYTLFTIPEPEGGTLIINKQTGQNGRSYDESRDLGRVPMTISTQEENTEDFTIQLEESGEDAVLKLIWGNTVFSVDVEF